MASTMRKLRDPNTLSNYDTFLTKHTTANFSIDFSEKRLTGDVVLQLQVTKPTNAEHIILDTSYLDIKDVKVDGEPSKWELASRVELYGSALKIQVGKPVELDALIDVQIRVNTTKDCSALQWFDPAQTSNKKHPYMFSNCPPIHARSVLPCQDTPDVKSTYDFNIRSPLPVIASGLSTGYRDFMHGAKGLPGTLLYTFKQEVPIGSYLFALASGDIATAPIGPRSSVATGPEELLAAQWELEKDTETFIQTAEKILKGVPYAWTSYNVLVLPPSFPFGGMENPVFTYATPTLISGDRENVDVIAHELAHSWSGNLVSNCSWEHFWLNEGWCVYLERRIMAEIHGEPQRSFSAIIGWKALSDSIKHFGEDHEFTKLIVDLKGKDPDDAFSTVPYEKGSTFLYYLETLIGKTKWDPFVPHYFSKFARKSLDSFEFKETLLAFFASDAASTEKLQDLDWDKWFFAPGFPPKPNFDTSLVDVCYALAEKWNPSAGNYSPKKEDLKGWTANQSVVFLERVRDFQKPLTTEAVQAMGETYGFTSSKNIEVVSRFLRVGLKARDKAVYQPTADLLGKVGRMKFVRPLFRDLYKADRDFAVETFERHESFYHPVCRQMVRQDLFGKK